MQKISFPCLWFSLAVFGSLTAPGLGPTPALLADETRQTAYFEQHIRPVLVTQCVQCHGEKKQEGGLRLDSLSALQQGGDSGPAVLAGEPAESLLIEALKYESYEMPPAGQLSKKTVAHFEQWIASGVHWPAHTPVLREEAGRVSDEDRLWWAFQPLAQPEVPCSAEDDWSRNEIDAFVWRKLQQQELQPAPPAAPATLVRRLYFDLLGLPPTPQEITAFVNDSSADAWEKLVDRLLSDQRYGEHWARHWLDLVRYSESDGWNQDAYRPHLWRYRDYVVEAFNSDKPYPEFVREQLAGDEMPGDDPRQLIAAGYLRLGIYEYNQRDARSHWNDIVNEMTDVTGDVFLGVSMACCRCHDHKFDPLPQKDYFKLRAFFEPVIWRDDLHAATREEQAAYQDQLRVWEQATREIREQIDALQQPYIDRKWVSTVEKFPLDIQACFHKPQEQRTSWEQQMAYLVSRQFTEEGGGPFKSLSADDKAKLEDLTSQLDAFASLKPSPLPPVMTATEFAGTLSPTTIPGISDPEPIAPGFLTVMSELPLNDTIPLTQTTPHSPRLISTARPPRPTSGRRTRLAQWIGDPRNPLTTRVVVNRIWQQHFGTGIVPTASDFGRNGQLPTHPELLDWLATTFVQQGWSFKQLHKTILMSATWQQSADHPQAEECQVRDPGEQLLWRAPVRRLQAEQIRDAMLVASGELNPGYGGPSVAENELRRSLYVKSLRNSTDTFLHGFDIANGLQSVAVRDATTTPMQALLLLNGDFALQRAAALAARLTADDTLSASDILRRAFLLTWGREPLPSELHASLQFALHSPENEAEGFDPERLVDFCHILFNSNEFLYRN
ncbi:MAG: PSD1 domain-containing protein [Planctomycetales bacterium]|nr:PSD1 domain-containing protein [Planctomycetales bacterium]